MSQRAPILAASDASHPPQARWRLRLLGAVELLDHQQHPQRLPTRAATLLLARLAMAPQRQHPREELVELLWPGVDNETGRNRLRQALSVLRSLLEPVRPLPPGAPAPAGAASSPAPAGAAWSPASTGAAPAPVLHADRRAVWLAAHAVACDVAAFEQALDQGRSSECLRLYQGELLPGHFDEWVLQERAHLAARAEALALRQPPAKTTAGAAPPPPALFEARLPRYLTRLIGFEGAGAALAAAVAQQRLVVLRGPGGAGKTRLAVEVARALAERAQGQMGRMIQTLPTAVAFDLVAFVPLASCSNRHQMLDTVLHTLQQGGAADASAATLQVVRSLVGRRVLLVLDNFEQLVEVGRQDLARWLSELPDLHLLVTSRRVLGQDGETEQVLPALPLPQASASLADNAMNPALALFVDRAQAARADFQLGPNNHAQVAELVRALHGLPLAIELAAARLRSLGLNDLLSMLLASAAHPGGQALTLLTRSASRSPDDARHASMLHVLQWSWQQLSGAEQTLLVGLSACESGASLALLSHLCAVGDAAPSLTGAALLVDALVAASVAYTSTDLHGSHRYAVFEPMREFVFMQLGPAGVAALQARHARAVAAWAGAQRERAALPAVRSDWANLLRALATGAQAALDQTGALTALDQTGALTAPGQTGAQAAPGPSGAQPAPPQASAEQAIDTALSLRQALEDLLLPPSALDHLRRAASAAPMHRTGWIQALLAVHSFEGGQRQMAAQHATAALAAPVPAQERAHVLRCVARVRLRLGDELSEVLTLADQAVSLARQHGQMVELCSALTTRGVLLLRRDHDRQADLQRAQELLALWREHGPPERVAAGLLGMALSLGFLHRVPEQLVLLDEARALATQRGQHRLLAFTTSVTGYALADLRRYAESAVCYRQCLQMTWDSASWREWFYALWNLPRTLAHLRQSEPAAQLMGFAQAFYAQRFGQLGVEDLPEARRTRRLVAAQVGALRTAQLWNQGAQLSMAEAMSLALAQVPQA